MINLRPVFLVVGMLMAILGAAMLAPAFVDLAGGEPTGPVFLGAAATSVVIGLGFWASARGPQGTLGARQAILMTVGAWVSLALLGALPLYWSGVTPTFTDAFFESMSGITTTGATVISGLDDLPTGILFWRAILQWLGGLGIIVMAVAVLPMLQIGGMQLFKAEAFDSPEKILPRATQISGSISLIYVTLTITCALLYAASGMELGDGIMHAMTTVATGGFSTKDASIGYFNSPAVEAVGIVFMILGSLPFILFIQLLQGRVRPFLRDSQVKLFLLLIVMLTLMLWFYRTSGAAGPLAPDLADTLGGASVASLAGLRQSAFNTISIMTGTGYASTNYEAWGPFATTFFFVIMFIGGCAGSTSCGIKIFRFQVLYQEFRQNISQILFPHGVFVKRFNGRPIEASVSTAVMSFFFLYLASVAVLAMLLSLTGLDTLTALSGAATAISNVGPGLGEIIGPNGNFQSLSVTAKWLLSAGMLLGRLELFTVLVLVLPSFWRN